MFRSTMQKNNGVPAKAVGLFALRSPLIPPQPSVALELRCYNPSRKELYK